MSSPLVRRYRLGLALRALRDKAGITSEELGKRAGISRLDVSRMETAARKPDTNKVMACLEVLGVKEDSETWRTLVRISRDANRKGWWDATQFAEMSERQKRCADVESGATSIRYYHNSLIPWVVQTADYLEARDDVERAKGVEVKPVQGVARLRRQSEVVRSDGPKITMLLEEQVIRRPLAGAKVMAEQLRHLVDVIEDDKQISIQVLPVECSFGREAVPLAPFSLYTYDDPADGTAMVLETINSDEFIYEQDEVTPYVQLFDSMRDAAMSEADSAAFITKHAKKLAAGK